MKHIIGLLVLLMLFQVAPAQEKRPLLPAGDWTQVSHPLWLADAQVTVKAVTTEAAKALAVTSVKVVNRTSDRFVTAVVLRWVIFSNQGGPRALRSGSSALIVLEEPLPPGAAVVVKYPLVTFGEQARALDTRRADFHLSVGIRLAVFDDGSLYDGPAVASSRWYRPLLFFMPCRKCQNQECAYISSNSCFECRASYCSMCAVSSCNSCTMEHCEEGDPVPLP